MFKNNYIYYINNTYNYKIFKNSINILTTTKLQIILKSYEYVNHQINFFIDYKNNFYLVLMDLKLNKYIQYKLNNKRICSINSIKPVSVWYEREFKEFNNVNVTGSKDTRNLLLPYNQLHNPSKQKDYNYKSFYPIISLKKKTKFTFRYLITL